MSLPNEMLPGMVNSPPTTITQPINAVATSVMVDDISVFPPAPNKAVLGTGDDAETVRYTSRAGNTLGGLTRGHEGTAQAWSIGTQIARNFTEGDHAALRGNANDLNTRLVDHFAADNPHGITAGDIGLGSVPNMPVANETQAQAGTANNVLMTPLRTVQALAAQVVDNLTSTSTTTPLSANQGRILNDLKVNTVNPAISFTGLTAQAAREAFFQNAAVMTASIPITENLNTLMQPGFYAILSGTNVPTGQTRGNLLVIPHGTAGANIRPTQLFFSATNNRVFFRNFDVTWGTWRELLDSGSLVVDSGFWTPRLVGGTTAGNMTYQRRQGSWSRVGQMLNITFEIATRSNTLGGAAGELRLTDLPGGVDLTNFHAAGACTIDGFRFQAGFSAIYATPRTGIGQNFINFRAAGFGTSSPFNVATTWIQTTHMTPAPNTIDILLEGSITYNIPVALG